MQPGVVDPAGLDDTAGRANISDDDGVLHVAGYLLKAEAATIPAHTHAFRCDKSCSGFECDAGYIQATPAAPAAMSFAAASSAVWASC